MEPSTRRYLIRFSVAMAAYCVLLPVALFVGRAVSPPWSMACALLVLPPVALMVRAVGRYFQEVDELARKVLVESLALGFVIGTPIVLDVGLFQTFGLADMSFMSAYAILMVSWLIGGFLARRRYF